MQRILIEVLDTCLTDAEMFNQIVEAVLPLEGTIRVRDATYAKDVFSRKEADNDRQD